MVEKIIISPDGVRGHGNIVSPKSDEDYIVYNSSLTEGIDIIEGSAMTVYEMEYDEPDITVSLTTSSATVTVGDSVTLTATVLDNSVPIDDVKVTFKQAGNLIGTSNTNSSGVHLLGHTFCLTTKTG